MHKMNDQGLFLIKCHLGSKVYDVEHDRQLGFDTLLLQLLSVDNELTDCKVVVVDFYGAIVESYDDLDRLIHLQV